MAWLTGEAVNLTSQSKNLTARIKRGTATLTTQTISVLGNRSNGINLAIDGSHTGSAAFRADISGTGIIFTGLLCVYVAKR